MAFPKASTRRGGPSDSLAGSLSLFLPGLGQIVAGERTWGLFFASGIGLCGALGWAVVTTRDRLVPTLALFDLAPKTVAIAVAAIGAAGAILHLAAVLHAHHAAEARPDREPPHPITAGLASLAFPGWGQILAGHRARAAMFLAGVWLLAAAWALVTPAGARLIGSLGVSLPSSVRDGAGPIALLAAPVVVWAIAVYDAAAGAWIARHRTGVSNG